MQKLFIAFYQLWLFVEMYEEQNKGAKDICMIRWFSCIYVISTIINKIFGGLVMAAKGVPVKNGSGKGTRSNKGRGGCTDTQKSGKGK